MSPAHHAACARILAGLPLYRSYGLTEVRAAEQLAGAEGDLLVVLDDEVLGFAWVMPRGLFGRAPYLKQVAVGRPGRGVGSVLLEAVERRWLSPTGLGLLVTTSNLGAQRFYQRRGYLPVGVLPRFAHPEHDELFCFKPFTAPP